jgi:uncharacterized protein (DUF58 family)
MILTRRAIIFFAFGGSLIYFLAPLADPHELFLFFNALFLALVTADFFLAQGPWQIRILRFLPERLSLGTANPVTLQLKNLSAREALVEVRDDYPPIFASSDRTVKVQLPPGSDACGVYRVIPPEKGRYAFGSLHLRVAGPLGMVRRQFRVKAPRVVDVYPNISEIGRYELMARRGRLMEIGMKPSRVMGIGTDFESLKEYEPDDDFRRINWKATARKGKLISSRYEMERSQNIILMIDAGRMMASRIDGILKVDYAMNAALMLSYVAMKNQDRVGLLTFAGEVMDFLPLGKGKRQMGLIIESLKDLTPRIEEPDFGKALRYLALRSRRRSLVVVFTDVIDMENSGALVKYLSGLYPAHLPLCVTLQDPYLQACAAQSAAGLASVYEKAVAGEFLREREKALGYLGSRGTIVMDVPPSRLTGDLVSRYLEIKLKGRL